MSEVEVWIVHPDGMGEGPGNAMDALPVSRHEVDALGHRLLDTERAASAVHPGTALEDVDRAQVERRLGPLRVEKPCVPRRERLVERRLLHPRAIVSGKKGPAITPERRMSS